MAAQAWIEAALLALAVALVMIGAVTAWTGANNAKRLAGLLVALIGAALTLGAIGAPPAFLVGAMVIAFATFAVGLAVLVRLQEAYGGVESTEIDAADRLADTKERGA